MSRFVCTKCGEVKVPCSGGVGTKCIVLTRTSFAAFHARKDAYLVTIDVRRCVRCMPCPDLRAMYGLDGAGVHAAECAALGGRTFVVLATMHRNELTELRSTELNELYNSMRNALHCTGDGAAFTRLGCTSCTAANAAARHSMDC